MEVSVREAKTHLSKLLARVALGEEIVIARAGTPVARLIPVKSKRKQRHLGLAKGEVSVAGDFDAPLPADVEEDFYR